jgi:hypothetical protein
MIIKVPNLGSQKKCLVNLQEEKHFTMGGNMPSENILFIYL